MPILMSATGVPRQPSPQTDDKETLPTRTEVVGSFGSGGETAISRHFLKTAVFRPKGGQCKHRRVSVCKTRKRNAIH
jgi:hypothetical protein